MKVAVHPRLVEEAVFLACRASAARGDGAPAAWLRRSLERAYRLPEGAERDLRFERVHAVAFRRLGLAGALFDLLRAHPGLSRADGPVRVGPAGGPGREGMDLHERAGPDGRPVRSAVASVTAATFADPAALAARLHRDALKVEDLLDPDFAWRPGETEPTPARREVVRIRLSAAWNAWADGRLERRGLPAPAAPGATAREFAEAFVPAMGPGAAAAAHEAVRTADRLRHGDLLALARDPGARAGGPPAGGSGAEARSGALPGAPCPFCRFPTHEWEPAPGDLPGPVRDALAEADPAWTPDQGLCAQCGMIYRSRAGVAVAS